MKNRPLIDLQQIEIHQDITVANQTENSPALAKACGIKTGDDEDTQGDCRNDDSSEQRINMIWIDFFHEKIENKATDESTESDDLKPQKRLVIFDFSKQFGHSMMLHQINFESINGLSHAGNKVTEFQALADLQRWIELRIPPVARGSDHAEHLQFIVIATSGRMSNIEIPKAVQERLESAIKIFAMTSLERTSPEVT